MDPIELAELIHNQSVKKGKYLSIINIYNETNENLEEIFNHYDIVNKDVLTVLASSDQLFCCYAKGAKNVDTFDIEYATLYYYYLRKWFALHKDLLSIPLEIFNKSKPELSHFISSINPENDNESMAKIFWIEYLKLNNFTLSTPFFIINNFKHKNIYTSNPKNLKSKLKKDPNFYHINIAKDINIDNKYDIIILSNILEYNNSNEKLLKIRDNIEKLLKDDGIAICSAVIEKNNTYSKTHQKEINLITSNKLKLVEEIKYRDNINNIERKLAYTYKKSR